MANEQGYCHMEQEGVMSQYRTATLDTSDLLKCAHCNGEPEYRDGSSTRPYIRCKSCGMRTGSSYDYDKLKRVWNRRSVTAAAVMGYMAAKDDE